MPLQNRVTPFGEIVATLARGMVMGNRGIIHDPASKTLLNKRWSNPAWIICVCNFRGRRRDVMATRSWTELFFLDEATALAAGHRPCFYCRRDDANAFRAAWCAGNTVTNIRASEIDAVLHRERRDGRAKRRHPLPCAVADLPDAAMIAVGDDAFVMANGRALRWSFEGYRASSADLERVLPSLQRPPLIPAQAGIQSDCHEGAKPGSPHPRGRTSNLAGSTGADQTLADATLLTPPSTLRALFAGYAAVIHQSAFIPGRAQR